MPERPIQDYVEEDLAPSAARTASDNSSEFTGYGRASTLRAQLDVTAVSGTGPTLDVLIEDSVDGANWNTIGTFAQKSAVSREVINISSVFADRIRARWSVGGTLPSFTFSVRVASQSPAQA